MNTQQMKTRRPRKDLRAFSIRGGVRQVVPRLVLPVGSCFHIGNAVFAMNAAERERSARAEREILLVNFRARAG